MTTKKMLQHDIERLQKKVSNLEDTISVLYHAQEYGKDGVGIITNMWDIHSFKVSYIKTVHDMNGDYKKLAVSTSCSICPEIFINLIYDRLEVKTIDADDTRIIFSVGYKDVSEKFVVLKDIEILIPYKETEGD